MSIDSEDKVMGDRAAAQGLVPRLRFPEFHSEWQLPFMHEVYHFKRSNPLSRDQLNYDDGDLKTIHYGDIHTKFAAGFRADEERVPFINRGEHHSSLREDNWCSAGDMVFADASEDMNDIGKAIEVIDVGGVPITAGMHTILARPELREMAVGFGRYLFACRDVRRQIQGEAQGAKVLGISPTRLGSITLPIPADSREQQKIADCMSSLDALIVAEGERLAALRDHKEGLMQALFPAPGQTTPRLRFLEYQNLGEWEEKPLGEICDVAQGFGFPDRMQGKSSGEYPFCKVSDISRAVNENGGLLDKATNYVDHADLKILRAKTIPAGATVFAKIGEALRLNRRAITGVTCLIDNNAVALKAKEGEATSYFLFSLSQTIDMRDYCGGAIPSVNKSTLESIVIKVPGLAEQIKIAAHLQSINTMITAQRDKIDTLKAHKSGLMQQLFPSPAEARA